MNINAKAPAKKCLTEVVKRLTLETKFESEQQFLAAMHEAFIVGGCIIVCRPGKPKAKLTCPR